MRRLSFVPATVLSIVLGFSGSAAASAAGGADNVVIATNAVDNSSVARANVEIAHDPSDTVANQNVASAQSSNCFGCRTVAVAMQVVIVEGYPHDFVPANAAAAVNSNCDSCQTYAYAFQYVVQPGRVVYLSGDAQRQLLLLRRQVDAVAADTTLSYLDMKAEFKPIFAQIVQTVSQDLVAAGASGDGQATESSQAA